jgi:zinc transport system substrate-binding protein
MDPHVWLDLANASKMVDTILAGVVSRDPANRSFYQANAES